MEKYFFFQKKNLSVRDENRLNLVWIMLRTKNDDRWCAPIISRLADDASPKRRFKLGPETCAFPFLKDDHDLAIQFISVSDSLTVDRAAL